MHDWLSTLAATAPTTVILAVITTFTISRFSPRLDARSVRIKAAWAARDQFSRDVLTILAAAGRLQLQVPDDASEVMRERLEAERARWLDQIDTATRNLVDTIERYVLGYPNLLDAHSLLTRYAGAARFVWISERPEETRVRMVREITEKVQGIVFAKKSYQLRHLVEDRAELGRLLTLLETPETRELAAGPAELTTLRTAGGQNDPGD